MWLMADAGAVLFIMTVALAVGGAGADGRVMAAATTPLVRQSQER